MTNIRHVSDDENVMADALSRVEEIRSSLDYSALTASQESEQIKEYERLELSLWLRKIDIPGVGVLRHNGGDTKTILDESLSSGGVGQHPQSGPSRDQYNGQTHSTAICLGIDENELPKLGLYMHAISTSKDHASCSRTGREIRYAIQKVRAYPLGYHRQAEFRGEEVLPHVCRLFHTLARGIPHRRSRSKNGGQSLL